MSKNNKFNADDYFSEEEEINQDDNVEDIIEEESDDSMDEETRRIIYKTSSKDINWNDLTLKTKQEPVKKKQSVTDKSKKTKNVLSLNEFVQKIENEEKTKQPKKFISKRVEERRKEFGTNEEKKLKRSFNARLPPYNFVHSKKEVVEPVNFSNELDFPSLK